jgi:hypothetical protein
MRIPLFFLLSLLFSACGSPSQTAIVTLTTSLEEKPIAFNLMDKIVKASGATDLTKTGGCVQTQIFAGFDTQDNKVNSKTLSTFPISLTTPLVSVSDMSNYPGGPAGWLAASNLDAIKLSAPTGVPLDFGIVGSLILADNPAADGSCPQIDPVSGTINPTYSVIGHTSATIKKSTAVPITLWITKAAAATADLPATPDAGSVCAKLGGNNANSQICPNLNYNQVKIHCPTLSACEGSVTSNGYIRFEYLFSGNNDSHVTQLAKLSEANNVGTTMMIIPDVSPLQITILNGAGELVESATWKSDQSDIGGTHPVFFTKIFGITDTSYPEVIGGSGVTPR